MFQFSIYPEVVQGLSGTSGPATALLLIPGDGVDCDLGKRCRCERAQAHD